MLLCVGNRYRICIIIINKNMRAVKRSKRIASTVAGIFTEKFGSRDYQILLDTESKLKMSQN